MKKFISGIARKLLLPVLMLPAVLLPLTGAKAATTVTWTNTVGTNDWFVGANWSSSTAPTNGDDVIITNTVAGNNFGVLLTNSVGYFSSVLLSNKCTLIFSNWDTSLSATNVTILTNSTMTCAGPINTNTAMSNRVYVICTNLMVGGTINTDGKGYAGGPSATIPASGPGRGAYGGAGGGHGGSGGGSSVSPGIAGVPYGLSETPLYAGSGGGWWNAAGGAGGGAIRIDASGGAVQLDGLISANGATASAGGGSGGGIYIQCRTFTGGGSLRANGGSSSSSGSGGGGGRIAIVYDTVAQAGATNPTGVFSTAGGSGTFQSGDVGTLYFPDTRFLSTTMRHVGQWLSSGFTNWSVGSLLLTNSWLRFPSEGFRLAVTGDVVMVGASRLDIGANAYRTGTIYSLYNTDSVAAVLSVGGNVSMATGCTVYLYGARTNVVTPDYGVLMNVTGDVSIASNAWIYVISHDTNGGSPLFRMSNLVVTTGGGFNANGLGYAGAPSATIAASGPGRGGYGGGGGAYGGYGGASGAGGGYVTSMPYGVSNTPLYAGSGGGWWNGAGGAGGGAIRIEAADAVQLDGTMSANGVSAVGGGAGGGIYVRARRFAGTTGSLTANGGAGSTGGGGGGRIAVWRIYHTYSGSASVTNGTTVTSGATVGTIVWEQLPIPGTIFTFH